MPMKISIPINQLEFQDVRRTPRQNKQLRNLTSQGLLQVKLCCPVPRPGSNQGLDDKQPIDNKNPAKAFASAGPEF
jgi:hypothetical protein